MANKIPLALERLVSSIKSSKTIFFTPVYTTFLQYPDEFLNSHQKLICIALMQLGQATRVLDQIKLEDAQFQLSAGKLAEMTGLSRSQANRAIKTLPKALTTLSRRKLFKAGEKIIFKIMDAAGNQIEDNNSGVAPYFYFEYTKPDDKISLGAKLVNDSKEKKSKSKVTSQDLYNKIADKDYNLKMKELRKLAKYFSDAELETFTCYTLIEIVKTVDYYLSCLGVKQQQKGSGAILNLGWLKKAFTEYKIPLAREKETMLKAVEYINTVHSEVVRVIGRKEINTKFHLIQTEAPKYTFNDFENPLKLKQFYESQLTKLTKEERGELQDIAANIHKTLLPLFKANNVPSEDQIYHIKFSIINKHFNLL